MKGQNLYFLQHKLPFLEILLFGVLQRLNTEQKKIPRFLRLSVKNKTGNDDDKVDASSLAHENTSAE